MRILMMMAVAASVTACSSGNGGGTKKVSAKGTSTYGIATDGASHVAYILNAGPSYGTSGELHIADADGKDTKIATGINIGTFGFSGDGKGLLFVQQNSDPTDANLQWVDVTNPSAPPKMVFATGMQTVGITSDSKSPKIAAPLLQQGFQSPSGRFYIVGQGATPDLHVIDMTTGNDVFQRPNGAFHYLELVLPNDVMIYQDAVGGNDGISGGAGVQTLFWTDLTSGAPEATKIDERTGNYSPTGDNKTLVYQRADTRELFVWDAVARPASGTKVASDVLGFAVGGSGPIAYIGTDGSFHVVGLDGKAIVDVAAATALADPNSPVFVSDDGADAYYFQHVDSQDSQGTLMHVPASAGAAPAKIADAASIFDVHPLPDGVLLYLANVDMAGTVGDAFRSARDGSGAMALGTMVPIGFFSIQTPPGAGSGSSMWLSAHLTGSMENMSQKLVDNVRAISGGLELTTATASTAVDPKTRIGQFEISDDLSELVYVGGSAFDSTVDNYVGALSAVAVASPGMAGKPLLTGVSEIGPVVKHALFVNAPKASSPGVYFVSF